MNVTNFNVGDFVTLKNSKWVFKIIQFPPFDRVIWNSLHDHKIVLILPILSPSGNKCVENDEGIEWTMQSNLVDCSQLLEKQKEKLEHQLKNINETISRIT